MDAPKLELDWEVGVFRLLRGLWTKVRPEPPPPWDAQRVVQLTPHLRRLGVLAQVMAGAPVRVAAARGCGGVRGRDLLLPPFLDLAATPEENLSLYRLRVAVSAALYRLQPPPPPTGRLPRALFELEWIGRAVKALEAELPSFREAHTAACLLLRGTRPALEQLSGDEYTLELLRCEALEGRFPAAGAGLDALPTPPRAASRRAARRESPAVVLWGGILRCDEEGGSLEAAPDPVAPPSGATTERQAPAVEEIRRVMLNPRDEEIAVLNHTFEKVETADSYRGGARDTDGGDELDDHLEALEEVELSEVMRGGDQAHSVYRAEISLQADVPDVASVAPGERGIPYDEWDGRSRRYREDWCTVYPTALQGGDPTWGEAARQRQRSRIDRLRRSLEQQRTRRSPLDRQLEGEDVDIAALVDDYATRRAGLVGSPRLYVRQERRRRSFATTILLDISLSTDAWVDNHRVLDVARDAVLVLGEVAEQLGDRVQVLAFASHTRNRCRVWEVRGWGEPWSVGRSRLGILRPQGYTRMGPALRHATRELAKTPADRRLLLLLSDGKPSDYDRYEGFYGIQDVRQALREASQLGICAHALAIEATARDYLPPMFGPGAWHILPRADGLPEVLSSVYGRMTVV